MPCSKIVYCGVEGCGREYGRVCKGRILEAGGQETRAWVDAWNVWVVDSARKLMVNYGQWWMS